MSEDRLQSESCAEKLRALGDPTRLRIIDVLMNGRRSVGEISEAVQMETVLVSHHLGVLHHAGILDRHKQGRFVFYSMKAGLHSSKDAKQLDQLDFGCCQLQVPRKEETSPEPTSQETVKPKKKSR